MEKEDLEAILQAFEKHKEQFKLPQTLSFEHPDITVKYPLSMLSVVEPDVQVAIVEAFCHRFDADLEQMRDLFSNSHNKMDYLLYTAFSVHCQQQLNANNENFFNAVAERTFLNYQDILIALARVIPINTTMKGMPKQFRNWTNVTHVEVETFYNVYSLDEKGELKVATKESVKRSRILSADLKDIHKVLIKRKTLDQYKKKLIETLGEGLAKKILQRDCDQTLYSFLTTFQKLYGQKDLNVKRLQSEADSELSIYEINPSAPYQTIITAGLFRMGRFMRSIFLPWLDNQQLKKKNESFQQSNFSMEEIISVKTSHLERLNAELSRRQETIVKLLQNVSDLKYSGKRHGIRNELQKVSEEEIILIRKEVAKQIYFAYNLVKEDLQKLGQLAKMCSYFDIKPESMDNPSSMEEILGRVVITNDLENRIEIKKEADLDFSGLDLSGEIYFGKAYADFIQFKEQHAEELRGHPLDFFDPFELFSALVNTRKVIQQINFTLDASSEFEEKVKFSEAIAEALKQARIGKTSNIEAEVNLEYDPIIITNKDTFVYTLRDLLYNAIDAGATYVELVGKDPKKAPILAHQNVLSLGKNDPVFYMLIRDDGKGIPPDKAQQINDFLMGNWADEKALSTKGKDKGGLGSKNLREFLHLHKGYGIYESAGNKGGTLIHLYFGKLKI